MAEFASKGVSGTALGLGIAGTVGLVNSMSQNGDGLLGGLFGGGNKVDELRAENTLLKSQRYTDAENKAITADICQLKAESAVQAEQIAAMKREADLKGQIMEGKIAQVADAANCGISQLQCSLGCLQKTVDGITRTFVPAAAVTPLPSPWPYPPVPPYYVPPTDGGTAAKTGTTSTTGA